MVNLINIFTDSSFYATIIRVSTPIVFASLGALVASMAGTPNVALEGIMLFSAFSGTLFSALSQSLLLGLAGGLLTAFVLSLILCVFSLKYKANIILTAIAINILASGMTVFLLSAFSEQKGNTSTLNSLAFPRLHLNFLDRVPFLSQVLNDQNLLTYIAYAAVIFVFILLKKTPFGIHLKAVGENPEASISVGLSVKKIKSFALIISGLLAGLGGMFLSMGYVTWFTRDMTAGRGWIALAAQALGGKSVLGVTLSSLLFSTGESLSYSLQIYDIPNELVQSVPFVITIIVLLIYLNLSQER